MARVNMSNQGMSGLGKHYFDPTPSLASQALQGILSAQDTVDRGIKGALGTVGDAIKDTFDDFLSGRKQGLGAVNKFLYGSDNPLGDVLGSGDPAVGAPSPGAPSPGDPSLGAPSPDYLYADLAKAYGMDASTAYQEALANTSYQRAVKDLQAAGLNPVLAATSLSGSGGVYGATPLTQVSPGIVSSGASSAHSNYKFLSNFGQVALGLGALLVTRNPYKAWTAASAGKMILGSLGNLMDKSF